LRHLVTAARHAARQHGATVMKTCGAALLVLALSHGASPVHAHGDAKHPQKAARPISKEETPFGREGDPKKVSRTIHVDMDDRMRFTPAEITVTRGETIRFRVKNSGKTMHEMVIGTMDELNKHAQLMKKHPGMEHDEPYMAHVAPGKAGTLVWHFTRPGDFYYGCLVPGHFDSGMLGKLKVVEK
jgi:uncharacterized cupredoxin-like copper-binding protein